MEELYQLSIALTTWLQESYPQLAGFASILAVLGEEPFFLVILPAVYWSINKRLGRQLGYIFLLSSAINNMLKDILRQPRPFWLEPDILLRETAGYGTPSGHVQHATAVFLLLAAQLRRAPVWIVVIFYIVVMGVGRLYLGVHFVQDLLVGFVAGLVIVIIFLVWQAKLYTRFSRQILGRRLMVMVIIPIILAILYGGALLVIGPPDMDVPWSSFIPAAELDAHEAVVSTIAGLLGFGIGMILESSRIRFRADGPLWQRIARYVVGIVVAVGIWAGLRAVFPAEPPLLALPLRFLRYLLLLLWVTYFAPWAFVRLRLASADAESEVRITFP